METENTFTIEGITIEDMLNRIFTKQNVKMRRKDIVSFYCCLAGFDWDDTPEEIRRTYEPYKQIQEKVDAVLKEDRGSNNPYLRYSSPFYSKAKRKGMIINPLQPADSNYIGKAGECMVMGELLFRGYNVNNMMVDEGIDLVASKDNVFFYIQVKTTFINQQNRFYFKITQDRFAAFVGTQIRYILVARCTVNNEVKTIFFKFTNDDIQRLMHCNVIPVPADSSNVMSLKIEYDSRTGKSYMYDSKFREDVSYYMNNFDL